MKKTAYLIKLFLATLFLLSPLMANDYLLARKPEKTVNSVVNLAPAPLASSPSSPKASQLAKLINANVPQVLGAEVKPSPTPTLKLPASLTIAVLGDSMVQTLQPGLPQLQTALKKYFPQTNFKLLNYGIGATDLDAGFKRIPEILAQKPDIIVVESFAYNHWSNTQTDLDRQWLTLAKIVDAIKSGSQAKIILAATIAPDQNTLCDGIPFISLTPDQKQGKAAVIKAYLQNLVNFANSQGYPLADAYHASLDGSGNGRAIYVNAGDHLHPSGPGGELFSQKIADVIWQNKLFVL